MTIHALPEYVRSAIYRVLLIAMPLLMCSCGGKGNVRHENPPIPVKVTEVLQKDMPVEIRTFGTIEASMSVTIQSQVTGILLDVKFNEGEEVRKGDTLFLIDPVSFRNDLQQAESILARNRILYENAKKETHRQNELLKKGLTSGDLYDQAKAASDSMAASIKSDEANVSNAKVKLGYCTIKSPVNGRTGKHFVDTGNLVKANDTVLGIINSIKPIEAGFTVPEHYFGEVSRRMKAGRVVVRAILPDNPNQYEEGELSFLDNSIDRETGTIVLKATFPNRNEQLWPGGFVKLVVVLSAEKDAIVTPAESVMSGQKGTHVYIARGDNTAEMRLVKVSRSLDEYSVIAEGLAPGERVIVEGQHRVGPGAIIEIKNPSAQNVQTKP